MKFHFNSPALKNRRKQLRSDSTETEKILWHKLRGNKLGVKFFRQYSVDGYVLDFYCPEKRLGIELDGSHHSTLSAKIYDRYRTRYLGAFNIKIFRFYNGEVKNDIRQIMAKLNALLLD